MKITQHFIDRMDERLNIKGERAIKRFCVKVLKKGEKCRKGLRLDNIVVVYDESKKMFVTVFYDD